jgi:hypothetical protein
MTLTISQIVNFKMVEDDLGHRKCYQCGGEILVPVVKHSVSDSSNVQVGPYTFQELIGYVPRTLTLSICTII